MILPILLNKTRLLPIYVVGIGEHERQRKIIRRCGFQTYQILYCLGGRGILKIENKEYEISSGDAFFFRPDVPHEYFPIEDTWKTKWVIFNGDSVENIIDYLGFGKSEVFRLNSLDDFDMQVRRIADTYWCDDPDKEIKTSMLMYKLLIKMNESLVQLTNVSGMSQKEKYEKLGPVISMMKSRYADDIGLDDMAESIGVTTNHLCRLFQQVYGTTPLKYLIHMRLNMAKYYLSSPHNMKVKDVAEAVGFKNTSYFCSVFKKSEGVTPDDYRKINAF